MAGLTLFEFMIGAAVLVQLFVLVFAAALVAARHFQRLMKAEIDEAHSRAQGAEMRSLTARAELADERRRHARLADMDPEAFLARPARDMGVTAIEAWIAPFRPALAEAYLRLAQARLSTAVTGDDVAEARRLAWGAAAADPQREEILALQTRLVEVRAMDAPAPAGELDRIAWRLLQSRDAADESDVAVTLLEKTKHRSGRAILISGWEPDEIRAAAREFLARPSADRIQLRTDPVDPQLPPIIRAPGRRRMAQVAQREFAAAEAVAMATEAGQQVAPAARLVAAQAAQAAAPRRGFARILRASPDPSEGAGAQAQPAVASVDPFLNASAAAGAASAMTESPRTPEPEPLQPANDHISFDPHSDTEADLRDQLERRRRPDMLGELHPRTLATRANIAHEMGLLGRHAEAEAEFRTVAEAMDKAGALGPDHADTLTVRHNMAVEMARQGKNAAAEAELDDLLAVLTGEGGPGEAATLTLVTRHDHAAVVAAQGRCREAEAEFTEVWDIRRRPGILGEDHPHTLWSRVQMLHMAERRGAA